MAGNVSFSNPATLNTSPLTYSRSVDFSGYIPSVTGKTDHYLHTDGTDIEWINIATTIEANAAVVLNTAKVTNATHSGDATGATALTLANAAITGKTTATAVGTDYMLISDTNDSGNLKRALLSDIAGVETDPVFLAWDKSTGISIPASQVSDFDTEVANNTTVAANTSARHAIVTIGTANGLSLSTQALSLAAATSGTAGALTSTDWSTFNAKQDALYHGIEAYTTLAFNDSTHVVSLATVTYWYQGVRYTTASPTSCDLDLTADRDNSSNTLTTNTLYYIYFNDETGKLYWSDSVWEFKENVFVATLFWNGSAGAIHDECHNHTRDLDWHEWAHDTIGTRYESGLTLTYPNAANDDLLQIETGSLHDEDIDFATGQCTTMRGWYKASANVFTFTNYATPYLGTAGQPQYLDTDTYALTNVGASDFVKYWVYATNDIDRPIYVFPTHRATAFNILAEAIASTTPVISNLNINSDFKLIYSYIYKGDGEYQQKTDFRSSSPVPGGGSSTVNASSVSFVAGGDLSSTSVQQAIEELDTEKAKKIATIVPAAAQPTVLSTNNGDIYECSGTWTYTLPDGMVAGFQITIVNTDSGEITLAAVTTLQTKDGNTKLSNQYGAVSVYNRGSNVWLAIGDLSA